MKMKALVIALVLVPFVAQADSGVYIGASFGQVKLDSSYVDDLKDEPQISVDDKSSVYKLTAGYQFNQYLAAELMYADGIEFSAKAEYGNDDYGYNEEKISTDSNMLGINLIAQYPFTESFSVYGKVGMGKIDNEFKLSSEGYGKETGSEKENYRAYGVGAKYNVNGALWVNAELERYSFDVESEDVDLDMWSVGVQYLF